MIGYNYILSETVNQPLNGVMSRGDNQHGHEEQRRTRQTGYHNP